MIRGYGKQRDRYRYGRYLHWKSNGASRAKHTLLPRLREVMRSLTAPGEPEEKIGRTVNLLNKMMVSVSINAKRKYHYVRQEKVELSEVPREQAREDRSGGPEE